MAIDNIQRIEDRIDRTAAGSTEIAMHLGGVQFKSMIELMEFAKLMAVAGAAVPPHLRGNPGACLGICTRALRFGFDPFALAEHSFLMVKSQKDENGSWEKIETMAFDSFVIHAIIEAHAPLTGRLRPHYEGEGDTLKVTVSATPKGEKDPLIHKSRTVGEAKSAIGRKDNGKLKGSPLWDSKPDQQIWYDARRDWCRKYYPEILLGWRDKDEVEEHENAENATNITPTLGDRLRKQPKKANDEGFGTKVIEHQISEVVPNPDKAQQGEKVPVVVGVAPQGLAPDTEPSPSPTMEALQASVEKIEAEKPQPETKPKRTRAPKAAAPGPAAAVPPELSKADDPLSEPVREMVREPVKEETAMERGLRLLPMTRTRADVTDLMYTIEEELGAAETAAWRVACKNRTAML